MFFMQLFFCYFNNFRTLVLPWDIFDVLLAGRKRLLGSLTTKKKALKNMRLRERNWSRPMRRRRLNLGVDTWRRKLSWRRSLMVLWPNWCRSIPLLASRLREAVVKGGKKVEPEGYWSIKRIFVILTCRNQKKSFSG